MLILLAVVDEGLGACFVGSFYNQEVQDVLGLPQDIRPIGSCQSVTAPKDQGSSHADPGRRLSIAIATGVGNTFYTLICGAFSADGNRMQLFNLNWPPHATTGALTVIQAR